MRRMRFIQAADDALRQAMAADPTVIVFGEDIPLLRRDLLVQFGPARVRGTPISESAFVGAAVTAAMSGLRPVAELYMVDFLAVCMDAVINHAAKVAAFSGGRWQAPLVIRAPCGGGYGDGGQHEQALWGWLGHIPGLTVVVPSTPADAGGLMTAALQHDGPVVFMEHKLLAETWLDFMGAGGRTTVTYDVPPAGAEGEVPDRWAPLPLGRAAMRREGDDLTFVTVGVGVHRALSVAQRLSADGIDAGVIDLRTVAPLDEAAIVREGSRTGRVVVIDEDYRAFGLSGEIAAVLLENAVDCRFARVCTETTIPYARAQEDGVLPNLARIETAARRLLA